MKFWLVKRVCRGSRTGSREGVPRSPQGVRAVVRGPVSGEWFRTVAEGLEQVLLENLKDLDPEALAGVGQWCWQVSLVSRRGEGVAIRAVLHPVRETYRPTGWTPGKPR